MLIFVVSSVSTDEEIAEIPFVELLSYLAALFKEREMSETNIELSARVKDIREMWYYRTKTISY